LDCVVRAVKAVRSSLQLIPFHINEIIKYSFELRKIIQVYIDYITVATALYLKEELAAENSVLLLQRAS
jgi:hypothetical protein